MKFVCETHGEVQPTKIGYSSPLTGWCPICDAMLRDLDGVAMIMMPEDRAKEIRPGYKPPDGERRAEGLLAAARPLIEWMARNCHPHCAARVDGGGVELTESVARCLVTAPAEMEKE